MTPRSRALTIGTAWGLIVTAVLVIVPLALRERLPDPLAVHWSTSGGPDRSDTLLMLVLTALGVWLLSWAVLTGLALHGGCLTRRLSRMYWWGTLGGISVFVAGLELSTLVSNLDRSSWQQAALLTAALVATVAGAVAAAVLAGYLGRGEPDQLQPSGEAPPRLRLREGQRSVWVARLTNPWLSALGLGSAAVLVVVVVLQLLGIGLMAVTLPLVSAMGIVTLTGLWTSSIAVRVTEDGVAVGFGLFGWPVRRIRLSKIETAWAEQRFPSQVGGWGVRGLPGSAAIMLRGGECLVLRYRSGGQLVISVDDAERAASLINALIEEHASR